MTVTSRLGLATAATAALATTLVAPLALAGPASAATHFANCTSMHHTYRHGVAKSAAAANYQVRQGYGRPKVSVALYEANYGSDRDKDGTACEA